MTLELVIFDLDNTLYPRNSGLLQEIGRRIQIWLCDHLQLSWEEAQATRREYYDRYGTTLGGLIAEHDVDVQDYLLFVHDIPVEAYLDPDPALVRMLDGIPLRKAIYTNAPSEYGRRVLEVLGVNGRFEQLIGIEEVGLRNKPYRDAFERALVLLDVQGAACIIVEDSVRNLQPAKALGLTTVLVDAEPDENVDYVVGSVLEVGAVVGELVRRGVTDDGRKKRRHR
jgi:putative hydrolase of the HAD superfamily